MYFKVIKLTCLIELEDSFPEDNSIGPRFLLP